MGCPDLSPHANGCTGRSNLAGKKKTQWILLESEDIVDVYVEETSSRLDGWIVEMNSGWKMYVVVVVLV